ncbi:MAG: HPt (histidine-containing phosphotransfer) domain-containing protein [Halieaceae bacterium]|jgi:HPt (histidine-containing phosphotransfer) domain-containing protein
MASKTDIVSLKWVIGLMNKQAENAEISLVEYSKDTRQKQPLLQCMWAVHQITSTLRALGIKKGELLSMEMERTLNFLYKDKVLGERRKLSMGGLMQALKVMPAYLAHVQSAREDTGRGLEQHVNDLRRWVGERPRPQAFFFHIDIPEGSGITEGASPASDEEIKSRANVMLALYLEMAKLALRKRNVTESMKTVARISRKMQTLFAGTEPERFWFTLIGICEGVAGGLIVPDECIAQLFKTGAFTIKYARENGCEIDASVDYRGCVQQMLYYVASCKAKPVHISNIRQAFSIDESTLAESRSGLVHLDALITALGGALDNLNQVVDYITSNDLAIAAGEEKDPDESLALEGIERAQQRLNAAGQVAHADSLDSVSEQLRKLYAGLYRNDPKKIELVVTNIVRTIVDVKLDLEYKLEHGVCSSFSSREFELRESVVSATFTQMSMVENHLHEILRKKALANAMTKKPLSLESTMRLTLALHRYLNKSDQGHQELRQVVREADQGNADIDLLCDLAKDFFEQLDVTPERKGIRLSIQLLSEISGALGFAGMERESVVMEQCKQWLEAASKAGSVHEDEAFRCFADAFAQIELHLQRSVIDPLDDTSHMLAFAEQRAAELETWIQQLPPGIDSVTMEPTAVCHLVKDGDIPAEFREVFIEEAEEIVEELNRLVALWRLNPESSEELREIRRHFHTFKGNGRAVGANILGELGWAAQDMLDRVLDGDLAPSDNLQNLLAEVVAGLPLLVSSYKTPGTMDATVVRELTSRCFTAAKFGGDDLAEDMPAAEARASGQLHVTEPQPLV